VQQNCPCMSGKLYKDCCQPYHEGKVPDTAVSLMRSRYSAYALGKVGYILKTHHPGSFKQKKEIVTFRKELKHFCEHTQFLGLQILGEEALAANQATVTFRAALVQNGADASFTESSLFTKVNGRWLYVKAIKGSSWGR
jgi:SEC-C motif domain protein